MSNARTPTPTPSATTPVVTAAPVVTENKVKATPVQAAVAVHSIVHGKGQRAEPGSFFTAATEAERQELLDLGAIREFEDEAELALYEKIEASKSVDLG